MSGSQSYSYQDMAGAVINVSTNYRYSRLTAEASLNYYLQAHKPALIGWFVGTGLVAGATRSHTTEAGTYPFSQKFSGLQVRVALRGGRHWALGQRWLLDTNAAVEATSYRSRPLALNKMLDLGIGYRF
jgi:hypothetical protein